MRLKGCDSALIDRQNIRDLGNRIIITGTLAIADEWMKYRNQDGSDRWELVPKEVLFDKDSLFSLQMSPLCVEHPCDVGYDKYQQLVADGIEVGSLSSQIVPDFENNQLDIVASVRHKPTIDAILSGAIKGLSPSYWKALDSHPDYSNNCFIQTSRDYSGCEVSLVKHPRGGKNAALHVSVDSADEPPKKFYIGTPNKKSTMATLNLDGIDLEMPDLSKQYIEKYIASSDAKLVTLTKERDSALAGKTTNAQSNTQLIKDKAKLEADNAMLTKQLAEIKTKAKKEQDSRDRSDIIKVALPLFTQHNKDFNADALKSASNREIKEKAIALSMDSLPAVKNKTLSKSSDSEVDIYWDSLKHFSVTEPEQQNSDSSNVNSALEIALGDIHAIDSEDDDLSKSYDSYYSNLANVHTEILK